MIDAQNTPTFRQFLGVFARIGCLSFGGPAGQIALIHRELIDERQWLEEGPFLRALNFCHLLPGPEAQQLATYIGWRMFGLRGGLAAGLLFIIPGALVMLALSLLYVQATGLAGFEAAMAGVKAAVIAIVVQALIRIARRALKTRAQVLLAIAAFVALFLFDLPFPIVIAVAALVGMLTGKTVDHASTSPSASTSASTMFGQSIRAVLIGCLLWAAPVALIFATLGPDHVLAHVATFFSKLAVVTFGGAYAVLAYMAQAAVQDMGWLSAGQMADGLGLAETTPGPLILVTQFVGFLGAWNAPAPFTPTIAAILASIIVLWVTFVPCFIWIFAFAPWIERLEHARRLHAALAGVTAAVVGVIANLALWFALHVLFTRVTPFSAGPIHTQLPDVSSFDPVAALLAAGAMILMLRFNRGPVTVLGLAVLASVALRLVLG
ncbi:chromate transporter [Sphingobium sp. SCG-1]|uniref:chromate efflux transporter n=1 Tax=Sphingobium sp. SCG-1 TaxID=2072936 RepID=UPI000CD6BF95|nr:chromate efflux transporter [Sphingobium sp. SCG-1]AUW57659.1 chromate transporter [Sphingobium sp. SCG-1]